MKKNRKQLKADGMKYYRLEDSCAVAFKDNVRDELIGEKHTARKLSNGTWEIPNFRIFAETKRFNRKSGKVDNFDRNWIDQAVDTQKMRQQRDQYLPPAHIQHTDNDGKTKVRAAGKFKDLRAEPSMVEGEERHTVFCTLTEIPDDIFQEMENGTFGYRSVEINKPDTPEISSLALLDSEVPYFKLPIARVSRSAKFEADRCQFAEAMAGAVFPVYQWPFTVKFQDEEYKEDDETPNREPPQEGASEPVAPEMPAAEPMPEELPIPPEGDPLMPPVEDPMAPMPGGELGGLEAMPEEQIKNVVKEAVQEVMADITPQVPPAPTGPVTASEGADAKVVFKDNPEAAAMFAAQQAKIAELEKANADREKQEVINRYAYEMQQFREEQDTAGGGKMQIGVNPQAIPHFAEIAKDIPLDGQKKFWETSLAVAEKVMLSETEAQPAGNGEGATNSSEKVNFTETVKDDDKFKRWFGDDRKSRLNPAEVEELAQKFSDDYGQLKETDSRRFQEYETEKGGRKAFVRDCLLQVEYMDD